jgi:hypothetical protein
VEWFQGLRFDAGGSIKVECINVKLVDEQNSVLIFIDLRTIDSGAVDGFTELSDKPLVTVWHPTARRREGAAGRFWR